MSTGVSGVPMPIVWGAMAVGVLAAVALEVASRTGRISMRTALWATWAAVTLGLLPFGIGSLVFWWQVSYAHAIVLVGIFFVLPYWLSGWLYDYLRFGRAGGK